MKFSDIKQFPFANYHVNVSWRYLKDWIKNHGEVNIDFNPPYQRGYVWSEEQKIAYVEYQLKGGVSGKDIYFNHPYWMDFSLEGELQIVDGKQRIQAVLDFLNNKIKAFGYYYNEFEDNISSLSPDFVIYINNLKSQKEVVEWYIGMNTGGSIHTEKDLEPAYEYLKTLEK